MLKQMEDQRDKEKKEEEKRQKKGTNKSATKEKVNFLWDSVVCLGGCMYVHCGVVIVGMIEEMTFIQKCLFSCCKQSVAYLIHQFLAHLTNTQYIDCYNKQFDRY